MSGALGWLKRNIVLLTFVAIAGLWLYSHVAPYSFGSCHEVPLTIGPKAAVRDCQAYGTTDFAVPLAIIVALVLLPGAGDLEISIPGFVTFKRTREGREAAEVLKEATDTLDQRGQKYLDTLPSPAVEPAPPAPKTEESSD